MNGGDSNDRLPLHYDPPRLHPDTVRNRYGSVARILCYAQTADGRTVGLVRRHVGEQRTHAGELVAAAESWTVQAAGGFDVIGLDAAGPELVLPCTCALYVHRVDRVRLLAAVRQEVGRLRRGRVARLDVDSLR